MTRLAIWRPESLIGQELKDVLTTRRHLWDDLRLLGPETDSGRVSEIADEATLVHRATKDNLSDVDLLFYCPEPRDPINVPDGLAKRATAIVVAGDEPTEGIPAIVAGVNSRTVAGIERPATLLSAHPAAVALAHLLEPLFELGLESCVASALLPSSTKGQEGIDELLGETRAILAFQPRSEESVFAHQLAFNVAPSPFPGRRIAETVQEVFGRPQVRIAVQASVGGVFHSLLLGAHVQLSGPTEETAVREALAASPIIQFAERPETLGPVDAAGSSSLHLGTIEPSTAPGSFWVRAVMDNLTTGGALNAIGIAEAILQAD